MALDYLRQSIVTGIDEGLTSDGKSSKPRSSFKKFSKGKFSLLLSGNLIIWVIFFVSIFDLPVFSKDGISVPHLPQKLAVTGIVYNETSPSVIISNDVYGVGDEVEGYTITRITRTEVEFQKDNKKILRQVH